MSNYKIPEIIFYGVSEIPAIVPKIVKNILTLIGNLPKPPILSQEHSQVYSLGRCGIRCTIDRKGALTELSIMPLDLDGVFMICMKDVNINMPFMPKKMSVLEMSAEEQKQVIGFIDPGGLCGKGSIPIAFAPRGIDVLQKINDIFEEQIKKRDLDKS